LNVVVIVVLEYLVADVTAVADTAPVELGVVVAVGVVVL
jgi:hypothetical protein